MAKIIVQNGESIEDALRRFKRSCSMDGTLQTLKFHEYHMSSTEKKQTKAKIRAAKAKKKGRR